MIAVHQYVAAACSQPNFFKFPTWYEYLPKNVVMGQCSPELSSINDIWLVVAACIEILLRVAALLAVFFVIYGGIQYSISQGNPDETNKARTTILNALIGLMLSVMAASIVQFVAGKFN